MRNAYAGVAAVVGWGTLALQFALTGSDPEGLPREAINQLSMFPILSNVMVATALTVAAFGSGKSRALGFFTLPTVQTGIAVIITITGIGHLLVLRSMDDPVGWALVADALLNYVMPAFFVGFWLLFVPKGTLKLGDLVGFLGFPVLYVVYLLVRGSLVHWYPYPFLDVGVLGLGPVAINVLAIGAAVALVGLAFIALDRVMGGPRGSVALS